jgi:hypothetical protein
MNQDQRLNTPHYLPRKYTSSHFHAKQQKMDQAGAKVKTEAPAVSFPDLYQQQIERVNAALAPKVRCVHCKDTGWLTVFCPENGTDIRPCDWCGEEA